MSERERNGEQTTEPVAEIVDLAATAAGSERAGALWSLVTADLNLNLVHFASGDGVAEHINAEVDVVYVVVAGCGSLSVQGVGHAVRAGMLALVPRGARRAIESASDDFAYLTCHRRRAGLMPRRAEPRGQSSH
jgi:quercetin dioxygenase-like cupin family protein